MLELIKLTQYSSGAGCGCKIAPGVLEQILHTSIPAELNDKLLVGYDTKDDAAVYDLGNGKAVISTTDFFMPIVDDAYDFGQIASVNAISDVYAMGGKPLMAIAILGWPLKKVPLEEAKKIMDGARAICKEANIPLAGGHSIDSPEPIFGLAVTGEVEIKNIKKNSTAVVGCKLFLTKPLGVGIITTAQKRGLASEYDIAEAIKSMTHMNSVGYEFGKLPYVKAMTDVTGFGLLGHLLEICKGSNLSAEIEYSKIPLLKSTTNYISQKIYSGAISRNWSSYEKYVHGINDESLAALCDPQTSGGLLVAVQSEHEKEFIDFANQFGYSINSFGFLTQGSPCLISIK